MSDKTVLEGTIRTFSEQCCLNLIGKMKQINLGLETAYDCKINCELKNEYLPVINDEKLYEKFKILQNEDFVELTEALMLSEDFSYYQKEVSGVFFFLGTKSDEYGSGLHTGTFDFDEAVLEKAVNMYYKIITKL